MSCQLTSGGKRLTSDHPGDRDLAPLPPRPVPQVTCRGWNPPPRSSYFQCGPDSLRRRPPGRGDFSWASSRSSSSTRCRSRSTDSAMAGTPAASALAPAVAVVAAPRCWPAGPERDMWRVTLLQLSQPTNLGKQLPARPRPTRLGRSCGSPSVPLPVRCSQRSASGGKETKKKKKKSPLLAPCQGLRVQGALGLGS